MRSIISARTTLFVLLFAAFCAGCSPVAWAPRETPHTSSIDIGQRVTLLLRDGTVLNGTYASVRELSDNEYATYYASATMDETRQRALPSLGQTVSYTTSLDESKVWKGELVGFDQSSILFADPQGDGTEKVYFSSLGSITGKDGARIRRMALRGMFLNGEIPLKTAVVIASAAGSMRIPVSEIERIRLTPSEEASGTTVAWIDARRVSWASK